MGVERPSRSDDVYATADFITLHLPKTPDTEGWLDAEAFAKCQDGVRISTSRAGLLVVDEDLQAALESGKVGGAALDVFRSEPITEHPLFGYPNVIVTPHLGASTAEATDRAGYQAAEQVVAALTGGRRHDRGQHPGDLRRRTWRCSARSCRSAARSGRIAIALAAGSSIDRVQTEFLGRIADRDTRLLSIEALLGVLEGHTEEDVNEVNAPAIAEERGIRDRGDEAPRRPRLHRPRARHAHLRRGQPCASPGRCIGRRNRPHLLEAWGHRFDLQLEDHLTLFRYRDVPGMIGRVGTMLRRARRQHRLRRGRPRAGRG